MMALLFADVKGFSKMNEREVPLFARQFHGAVADLIKRSRYAPIWKNTWGDGFYFVFRDVNAAGLFALEFRDLVAATNWTAMGFRWELNVRTGLHVGPVYKCWNPITDDWDYIGTHVSQAARIEPITPEGQVYASEVFAAIAFAEGAIGFSCEYVGRMGLAKNYGTYPTYHVRRANREKVLRSRKR
jgi:class 3 adenylate cyclase